MLRRVLLRTGAAIAIAAAMIAPAGATSLMRAGLDTLVRENAVVVVGQVVDVYSHWNAEGTFILSDVRLVVDDVLKGDPGQREFTFTAMGGTVGDLSSVIIAGPEIEVGGRYLLFLNREDVPGLSGALMVRDLSQGIFDVKDSRYGSWAISQSVGHGLLPDAGGNTEPVGGYSGMPLDKLSSEIRRLAGRDR